MLPDFIRRSEVIRLLDQLTVQPLSEQQAADPALMLVLSLSVLHSRYQL
ncbi:MAG: hypothetical protein U0165_10430 [Polyangiaceae bacterium]